MKRRWRMPEYILVNLEPIPRAKILNRSLDITADTFEIENVLAIWPETEVYEDKHIKDYLRQIIIRFTAEGAGTWLLKCLVELERRLLELDEIQDRLIEKDAPISKFNLRIRTNSNGITGEICKARPIKKVQYISQQQVLFELLPEEFETKRRLENGQRICI
jgi:hypothetical protein